MRWRVILGLAGFALRSKAGLLLAALVLSEGDLAFAQGLTSTKVPGPVRITDRALRTTDSTGPGDSTEPNSPEIEVDSTEVRTEAPAVPGARMMLSIGQGAEKGTRYRWVQTGGPVVAIDAPDKPSIQVFIPGGADKLEFLVIAAAVRRSSGSSR